MEGLANEHFSSAEFAQRLQSFVVPITVTILLAVYYGQQYGTSAVGALYGPVMFLYFTSIAIAGIHSVIQTGISPPLSPLFLLSHTSAPLRRHIRHATPNI